MKRFNDLHSITHIPTATRVTVRRIEAVFMKTVVTERRERKTDRSDDAMENKCRICRKNAEGLRDRDTSRNIIKKRQTFCVELSRGTTLVKQRALNINLHASE